MKKHKIALLHGAKYNAGDFLIRNRARQLLEHFYPDYEINEYYRNKQITKDFIGEIDRNDIAILAGGPAYYNDFRKVLEPFNQLGTPLFAMGLGWFGFDETSNALYNDVFDDSFIKILSRIERDSGILGCRDFNSIHVLRNNGLRRMLMTGCPAWYNISKVNQLGYEGPSLRECKKICISDCSEMGNLQLLVDIMALARNFFGEKREINLVMHNRWDASYDQVMESICAEYNINRVDISGNPDGFAVYDTCDIHIGFRVHAHIYMLSERKLSVLVEEDARGGGVNSALGLPHIRAFWSVLGNEQLLHIENSFVVREIQDFLFDLHENSYWQMEQAYRMMNQYFRNMEVHMKQIEKVVE